MWIPCDSVSEESAWNVGDLGSIPGLERSPGGGHGNPHQYSGLENPHGQRSLVGYSPWGFKELDTTAQLSTCICMHTHTHISVQFICSVVSDSATPWTAACQASLSITNSWSLQKLMSIMSVMPSNRLILHLPRLLLPSIFPSIRVFSSEVVLHIRWPKNWSFSFSINPSNEYSGLISYKIDWLDLLAVRGTLKRLLQHHSSKASILQCSAFFIVQLSHPYMMTGKTIALTRWTFVDNVSAF